MLYKEAKSAQYLDAFEQVFSGDLALYRERFFGGKAAVFLRLAAHVVRNEAWLTAPAREHLLKVATSRRA